ncbi:MAG: ZIP family metal transporter, partial [Zestosphaera sp.]
GGFLENLIVRALLLGLIPASLTSLGGIIGLIGVKGSEKHLDIGLGFSAGIMVVASFTSLLLPAVELGGASLVTLGFLAGVGLVVVLDKSIPHDHLLKGYEGPSHLKSRMRRVWLMVMAILIHNLPEGLAVGSSSGISFPAGLAMALAIGVQDIPEGFAVSFPIAIAGKSKKRALGISVLSGLSETLMAVIAALLSSTSESLLVFTLSLAGGSMIYIVSHEVIPETHRHGHEWLSTLGFLSGFITMLWLDTMLS